MGLGNSKVNDNFANSFSILARFDDTSTSKYDGVKSVYEWLCENSPSVNNEGSWKALDMCLLRWDCIPGGNIYRIYSSNSTTPITHEMVETMIKNIKEADIPDFDTNTENIKFYYIDNKQKTGSIIFEYIPLAVLEKNKVVDEFVMLVQDTPVPRNSQKELMEPRVQNTPVVPKIETNVVVLEVPKVEVEVTETEEYENEVTGEQPTEEDEDEYYEESYDPDVEFSGIRCYSRSELMDLLGRSEGTENSLAEDSLTVTETEQTSTASESTEVSSITSATEETSVSRSEEETEESEAEPSLSDSCSALGEELEETVYSPWIDKETLVADIIKGVVAGLKNTDILRNQSQTSETNSEEEYINAALQRHYGRRGERSLVYHPLEFTQVFKDRLEKIESKRLSISSDFSSDSRESSDSDNDEVILYPQDDLWELDSDSDYEYAEVRDTNSDQEVRIELLPTPKLELVFCYDCHKYFDVLEHTGCCPVCAKFSIEKIIETPDVCYFTETSCQCLRCLTIMDAEEGPDHLTHCTIDRNYPRCLYADGRGIVVCLHCEELFDIDDLRGSVCMCTLPKNKTKELHDSYDSVDVIAERYRKLYNLV